MTTPRYLGELNGIVIALKKTRRLRGNVVTTVLSYNCGVIEKLRRGAAVSDDVRVCRRIDYILHNEANAENSDFFWELRMEGRMHFRGFGRGYSPRPLWHG